MISHTILTSLLLLILCGCANAAGNNSAASLSSVATGSTSQFNYLSVSMEDVVSTVIAKVGYDSDYKTLLIRFRTNGSLYAYYDVSKEAYEEFLSAESLGSHFNAKIKDNYEYEELEPAGSFETKPLYDEASKENASFALNTGTGKFHKLDCRYADGDNIAYVSNTKTELTDMGYIPCKVCDP